MWQRATTGASGGGSKRAEGTFSTIAGTATITVSDLSEIEFVLAYYTQGGGNNSINTSASKINGTFTSYQWYGNVSNKISAINGNTFDITWGSANSGWNYIAYGK